MSKIRCKCDNMFDETDFIKHFPYCNTFQIYFNEFDTKFAKLLKGFTEDKENLFILRILLKQYTSLLEEKIKIK